MLCVGQGGNMRLMIRPDFDHVCSLSLLFISRFYLMMLLHRNTSEFIAINSVVYDQLQKIPTNIQNLYEYDPFILLYFLDRLFLSAGG